jgi:hypothetical protein
MQDGRLPDVVSSNDHRQRRVDRNRVLVTETANIAQLDFG